MVITDNTTSRDISPRYTLEDLLGLMSVLRDPQQGCPWDIRQRWETIVPHTLEEAYEVADAIERQAFDELPGELGDLLFQVVYYAQFGREEGRFDFGDVVHTLTAKMLRRHPHVFPDGTLASRREGVTPEEAEIKARWEAGKAAEREVRGDGSPAPRAVSALADVPTALPALSRANKLSKRAATQGFDWPDEHGVLDKVREELAEVESALAAGQRDHAQAEVGDLLFAAVNLARRLGCDPEQQLRQTNAKFERRFRYVEHALAAQGLALQDSTLEAMERHWQAAKASESDSA